MKALEGLLDAVHTLGPICDDGIFKVEATDSKVFVQALNETTDESELFEARTTGYLDEIPTVQGYGELNAPFDDLRGNFFVGRHSVLTGLAAQHRLSIADVVVEVDEDQDIYFIRFDNEEEFISKYMIGRSERSIPYSTILSGKFTPVVSCQIDKRAADLLRKKDATTEPIDGQNHFWLHMNKRGQLFASFDQKPKSDTTDRTMLASGLPYFAVRPFAYPSKPVLSVFALAKTGTQITMKFSKSGAMALELQTNLGHYTVEIWGHSGLIRQWTPGDPESLMSEAYTRYHDEKCMHCDWEPEL